MGDERWRAAVPEVPTVDQCDHNNQQRRLLRMRNPFRSGSDAPQRGEGKISDVIQRLAAYVCKDVRRLSSGNAERAALMLAGAAWNSAIDEPLLSQSFRQRLAKIDGQGLVPWNELRADNAAELIAVLVEFKKRSFPDDFRRIVSLELTADGVVRANWLEPDRARLAQASAGLAGRMPRAPGTAAPGRATAPAFGTAAPATRKATSAAKVLPAAKAPPSAAGPASAQAPTAAPTSPRLAVVPEDGPPPRAAAGSVGAARQLPRRQPIADKLLRAMKRYKQEKVVDLGAVLAGRRHAEDLQQTIASEPNLARLHPAAAAYAYAQNVLSVMSEQLTALQEMDRFTRLISAAEEQYMPGGPPMSPLTTSYFTCWALCDVCVGLGKETISSIAIALASAHGMQRELLRVMGFLEQSRMGIYVHQGVDQGRVLLRELVTGRLLKTISPAGYLGNEGEIWYVRVLPPPVPEIAEHLAFTTPYVLVQANEFDWQSYFRRHLPDAPPSARLAAYERHMKYGPSRNYWHDFLLDAYVDYRREVIYLTGIPDIPETLPHHP